MKTKTFYFMAAVIGECCVNPHVHTLKVRASTLAKAYERARKRLDAKGFSVGDLFAVRSLPKEVRA